MISLTPPLQIGIYHDNACIKTYQSMDKTSNALPRLFDEIMSNYTLDTLYYAKGPGSFMAIKITYIFLRTLSITQNIPLLATQGFEFNNNQPIKATGALYFLKKDGKILTKKIEVPKEPVDFILPKTLKPALFTSDTEPLYVLPAV